MVSEQRKKELESQIEKEMYDFNDPYACKLESLKRKNFSELSSEEQEKYRNFKMEFDIHIEKI